MTQSIRHNAKRKTEKDGQIKATQTSKHNMGEVVVLKSGKV